MSIFTLTDMIIDVNWTLTKRIEQKISVRIGRNCSHKQRQSRKEKKERKEKDAQNSKIDLVENVARIYYSE